MPGEQAELQQYPSTGLGLRDNQDSPTMRVWSFWDGPKSGLIELCQETLLRHVPDAQILTRDDFESLRTTDADVDISHLQLAHQADWIRLYLLKHFGGLWLDADCIVLRPLDYLLAAVRCCWSMTYYELSGHIGGGLIGTPPNSAHINAMYATATHIVKCRVSPKWRDLLGANMESVLRKHGRQGFFELDCRQFLPIGYTKYWTQYTATGTDEEHQQNFSQQAITYMLYNNSLPPQVKAMSRKELLEGDLFLSYVFRRALA